VASHESSCQLAFEAKFPLYSNSRIMLRRTVQQTALRLRGAAGHGGAMAPSFVQRRTDVEQFTEEDELVWDDGVAPETAIDFDAPHVNKWKSLGMWLGGFAFFATLGGVITVIDPPSLAEFVSCSFALEAFRYCLSLSATHRSPHSTFCPFAILCQVPRTESLPPKAD